MLSIALSTVEDTRQGNDSASVECLKLDGDVPTGKGEISTKGHPGHVEREDDVHTGGGGGEGQGPKGGTGELWEAGRHTIWRGVEHQISAEGPPGQVKSGDNILPGEGKASDWSKGSTWVS
jgi:hypothetical protein